jgi:hypothetical protein
VWLIPAGTDTKDGSVHHAPPPYIAANKPSPIFCSTRVLGSLHINFAKKSTIVPMRVGEDLVPSLVSTLG